MNTVQSQANMIDSSLLSPVGGLVNTVQPEANMIDSSLLSPVGGLVTLSSQRPI